MYYFAEAISKKDLAFTMMMRKKTKVNYFSAQTTTHNITTTPELARLENSNRHPKIRDRP